ncbi:MAG: hypothetical protein ACYS26_13465 [Planctomycetota bacterium]
MRQINPVMAAGAQAADPRESRAKQEKFLKRGKDAIHEKKKYRLYHGDKPAGMVIECNPMEANAWNRNAAAFLAWQASIGREHLPLMEWKPEKDDSENPIWRVRYKENGQEKMREVCGQTKAEARREFESVASVTARVIEIERDDLV